MAFSIKLRGMTWRDGEYALFEVPGEISGDRVSLSDFGFKQINMTPGHLDYVAVLSLDQALQLANSHYDGAPVGIEPTWEQVRQSIASADFIIAHLFEWESGHG